MESKTLSQNHQYFSLSGNCLNVKEKTNLRNSLVLLQRDGKFHRVEYWGKLVGIKGDYHIAQGIGESETDAKTSFYSVDEGLTWKQLTKYDAKLNQYLERIRGYFIGNPSHYYVFERIKSKEEIEEEERKKKEEEEKKKEAKKKKEESKGEEEEGEEEEEEKEEEGEEDDDEKKKKKSVELIRITEELRLTFTINNISHDTSVVPRGSFVLKLNGKVEGNPIFKGLSKFDSGKLENYFHLRGSEKLKSALETYHLNKSIDFCDTIDEDIPNKSWVLQYDEFRNVMVGKSLLWPGYVFYHIPNSATFGAYYIGSGQKNLDLCFML